MLLDHLDFVWLLLKPSDLKKIFFPKKDSLRPTVACPTFVDLAEIQNSCKGLRGAFGKYWIIKRDFYEDVYTIYIGFKSQYGPYAHFGYWTLIISDP